MAIYKVKTPDGNVIKIKAPEGATQEQLFRFAKLQISSEPKRKEQWYDKPRAALQGMTFGFSDEIGSAIAAPFAALATGNSVGDTYRDMQQATHREQKQYAEDNPYTSMALEAGGGILSGGVGGLKAANTVLRGLKTPAKAAIVGGLEGGLYGAGSADEGGRIENAGKGALIGGAIGGLGAPVVAKLAEKGGNTLSWAGKKIADTHENESQRAIRNILKAESEGNIEEVLQKYTKMGPEATLADVSPTIASHTKNALLQTDVPRREIRDQFQNRGRAQVDRVNQFVADQLGVADVKAGRNLLSTVEEGRKAQAGPLYQEAYEHLIPLDAKLKKILGRQSVKDGMRQAAKNLSEQDLSISSQVQDGKVSIRLIDELKKVLDDQASAAARAGKNHKAGLIGGTAKELRNLADESVPVYKEARGVFAGAKGLEDAYAAGKDIFKPKTDVFSLADDVANMGDSAQKMYQAGVLEALTQKTGKSGFTRNIMNQFDSPDSQMRLKAAFGNDEGKLNDFLDFADKEMTFNRVKGLLDIESGAQTALLNEEKLFNRRANQGVGMFDFVDQPAGTALKATKEMFRTSGINEDTAEKFVRMATDAGITERQLRELLTASDPLEAMSKLKISDNAKLALAGALASVEESMRQ